MLLQADIFCYTDSSFPVSLISDGNGDSELSVKYSPGAGNPLNNRKRLGAQEESLPCALLFLV